MPVLPQGSMPPLKMIYNITVLRGQSVSEILLNSNFIGYTGLQSPGVVLALSDEALLAEKKCLPTYGLMPLSLRKKALSSLTPPLGGRH